MERLELRGAVARYGDRVVLDALDVSIDPSERVAVIGPNGSGKTTLLRALAGIIPLASGAALPVDGMRRHQIARRIAFLPQEERWEFPFTVAELVRFGRFAHSVSVFRSAPDDASAVDAALDAVDLDSMRDRPVTELSGGERRRAALARALAQRAPALLLDEPTTALDLEQRQKILDVIRARDGGVVMATHDLDAAAACCSRILVLRAGGIVADGAPDHVLTEERLFDVFSVRVQVLNHNGRIHVVTKA